MTQNKIPPTPPVLPSLKVVNSPQNTGQKKRQNQQKPKKTLDEIIEEILLSLKKYKDQNGVYYADFSLGGKLYFDRIGSDLFKQYLNEESLNRRKQYLFNNFLTIAISRAEHLAERNYVKIYVGRRFKGGVQKAYIDLCDQNDSVIEIDIAGWRELKQQSIQEVRFTKDHRMLPLTKPAQAKCGDALKILDFVNLHDKKAEILFMVCLCIMPITDIQRPIVVFKGPGGSGKTFASRLFRNILDDKAQLSNNTQKKEDDFSLVYSQNAIPLFDNISDFTKKESDMFCMAISGGSLEKRKHYLNSGIHTTNYDGPALITCINMPSERADFLDRVIVIEFNRISKTARKSELALQQAFEKDKAIIFGGILETLSQAMRLYPNIKPKEMPRLADFALFGSAIAQALGYSESDFHAAIESNEQTYKTNVLLRQNPVAEALIDLYRNNGEFEGSTSELYKELNNFKPDNLEKRWPNNAIGLGKILKNMNVISIVADEGISIESKKTMNCNIVTLKKIDETQEEPESDTSKKAEIKETENLSDSDADIRASLESWEKLMRCYDKCIYGCRLEKYIIPGDEEHDKNYCEIKDRPFVELTDEERINCKDFLTNRTSLEIRTYNEMECSDWIEDDF